LAERYLNDEGELQKLILEWLNYQPGIWAQRVQNTGIWDPQRKVFRTLKGFSEKGVPDIFIRLYKQGWVWGKSGVIEVKTHRRAMVHLSKTGFICTPEQKSYIDKVIRFGGFGGVAWTLEMAKQIVGPHL